MKTITLEPADATSYKFIEDGVNRYKNTNTFYGDWSKELQKLLHKMCKKELTSREILNASKKIKERDRCWFIWTVMNCIKLWRKCQGQETEGFIYLDVNKMQDCRLSIREEK